jgi:voltage-gated sodium channel
VDAAPPLANAPTPGPPPAPPPTGDDHGVRLLRRVVESAAFQRSILGLIVVAAVVVGIETYPGVMARWGEQLHAIDKLIIWLFAAEAALKMASHGRRWYRYFQDPWNIFDFTIVVVCFLPINGEYAAVLRLARVLRAMRLISAVPRLQLLVGSLLKSLPAMFYVGILLAVLFYIYAVLGVFLFRDNDPVHFGDLQTSLLSLFRVVTLEDWTDIMYTQMYGSDRYGYDLTDPLVLAQFPEQIRASAIALDPSLEPRLRPLVGTAGPPIYPKAHPYTGALFFVSFVLLGTMIMLNLFIGVIIKSMEESQADQEAQLRAQHVAATGKPSVGDELAQLEHELSRLARRVQTLRRSDSTQDL